MSNHSACFYKTKYHTMLITGTFAMAMVYIMMLSSNIIAGLMIGKDAVAAINIVAPLISVSMAISLCVSEGTSVLYSRAIGKMKRDRADKLYGMGVIVNTILAIVIPVFIFVFKNIYLNQSGVTGDILKLAREFYFFLPLECALLIFCTYFGQMVYNDGDEKVVSISYFLQFFGNICLSIVFAKLFGIRGIMMGTCAGNLLALISLLFHSSSKANTLKFVYYFNFKELIRAIKYSITDGLYYFLWGVVDYVLISFISRNFGEEYLVLLAVAVSLIEFSVVFDGIGMAIQPLIGVYLGEKNHLLIRRLMKDTVLTAIIEGVIATVIVYIFAPFFARLFGINDPTLMEPAVIAIRIMCSAFVANALFMLETSYYLYTDHIWFAVVATFLKDGILYMILPLLFGSLIGINGIWIGFALAPVLAIILSMLCLYFYFGKKKFPWILENMDHEIVVMDDLLSLDSIADVSEAIHEQFEKHGYDRKIAMKARLFAEEIFSTIREKNEDKKVIIEVSLLYDDDSVRLIFRDSGKIFDITDPDLEITSISSLLLNKLLSMKEEKDYIPTTGYNKNVLRFYKNE